ncbi:MAG TPA: response regulator [Methylomirabilota bacterium]|nr:response regulator [Methylomirabilota bacterium]
MSHNACYAMPIEYLDIVVVEDSKPMQMILRTMLSALQARRIRVFDNGPAALKAMVLEPPTLVITDLRMPGMSGLSLLRAMRSPKMDPLCFVPVIVVTAHATQGVVEEAMNSGAHLLLVKPVSPTAMVERINWIISDTRHFVIGSDGGYVISGVTEKLAARRNRARAMHLTAASEARDKVQDRGVDRILTLRDGTGGDRRPLPAPTRSKRISKPEPAA